MPLYVALGVNLRIGLQCKNPYATTVTFKAPDGAALGAPTVLTADHFKAAGAGTYKAFIDWPGSGVGADEWNAKVTMENEKFASTSKPTEIVVFRNKLVVKAIKDDATNTGLPGVRVKVTITPDAAWKAATSFAQAAYSAELDTDRDGHATFPDLPFGTPVVEFLSPTQLVSWVKQTGGEWTAKVKKNTVVTFEAPTAATAKTAPHLQWVNLDEAKARRVNDAEAGPHYGSLVKLHVKAPAGTQVWVGALFDAGNSKRTGRPRPGLEGTAATPGTLLVKSKAAGDNGVATFDLELGAAGGDKCAVYAAGHDGVSEASHDVETHFITWRRLELHLVPLLLEGAALQAKVDEAFPTLVPEAKAKVETELALAFVKLKWVTAPKAPGVVDALVVVVTGDVASDLEMDPTKKSLIYIGSDGPEKSVFTPISEGNFYPPRVHIVPFTKMIRRGDTQSWTFDLDAQAPAGGTRAKEVENIRATIPLPNKSKQFFLKRDWTGRGSVLNWKDFQVGKGSDMSGPAEPQQAEVQSHWVDGDVQVPITADYLQVDYANSANLKCDLKVPKTDRPRTKTAAKVYLRLQMYEGLAGSASSNWFSAVFGNPKPEDPDFPKHPYKVAYTILHELGHAVRVACSNPSRVGYGPETSNPLHYTMAGDHCSYGIADPSKTPWLDPASTVSGDCVLFSPARKTAAWSKVAKYCPTCLLHMKAASFGWHPEAMSDLGNMVRDAP